MTLSSRRLARVCRGARTALQEAAGATAAAVRGRPEQVQAQLGHVTLPWRPAVCGYCPRLPRLLGREPGSRPRGGSGLLARAVQQLAQAGRTPAVATPGCAESTPGTPLSWQRLNQNRSTGWGLGPLGGQWDFPGLSSQSCEAGHQQRDILGIPPSQGGSGQPPLLSGQTTLHRNLEDFRRGTLQCPRSPDARLWARAQGQGAHHKVTVA